MNTNDEQNINTEPENIFDEEAIENITKLAAVLERIHNRLVSEGVDIEELKKKYPPLKQSKPTIPVI